MTLVEFLLARISEDEAVARAATPGPWDADRYWFDADGTPWACVGSVLEDVAPKVRHADGSHIASHNPARVLAECEAKRWIVEECGWETVMRYLAQPYADHPDYDESWRP